MCHLGVLLILGILPLLLRGEEKELRKHIFVISDTHIGAPWFHGEHAQMLPQFLEPMTWENTTAHTFVWAGDFLDLAMHNFTEHVPTGAEMLAYQDYKGVNVSYFSDVLRRMLENKVRVFVIRGNHDIELRQKDFDEVGLSGVHFVDDAWIENNYKMQHGHQYDVFCAPDPSGTLKPLGIYTTRCYCEHGDFSHGGQSELVNWLCDHILAALLPVIDPLIKNSTWIMERIFGGALGEKVWEELFNKRYEHYKHRTLSAGCPFLWVRDNTELWHVTQRYRTIFGRWLANHDVKVVQELVKSTCGGHNEWFIERVTQDLYVQGHTHKPILSHLERDLLMGGWVTYANTGAWVAQAKFASFVRVTTEVEEEEVVSVIGDGDKVEVETRLKIGNAVLSELVQFNGPGQETVLTSSVVPWRPTSELHMQELELTAEARGEFEKEMRRRAAEGRLKSSYRSFLVRDPAASLMTKKTPAAWTCDPDFYDTNDGCDCGCGAPDPDCKCTHKSECEERCCYNH